MRVRGLRIIALTLVFLFVVCSCGAAGVSHALPTQPLSVQTPEQTLSLTVEVADSDAERRQGLMGRSSLGEDLGMLFVFEDESLKSFWMKDTMISLDILFINAAKEIIFIAQNTTPQSLEGISSEEPCRYVLEVSAGYVAQHGVAVGDRVSF